MENEGGNNHQQSRQFTTNSIDTLTPERATTLTAVDEGRREHFT